MMTDTEIANGWIAEISANNGVVDPDRCIDVAMVLDDVIYSNPERAWAIITMMSQTTMSQWALENYSAGPLTTFVSQHGKQFAERIRSYCRLHSEFRYHLLGVVFQDDVSAILDGG